MKKLLLCFFFLFCYFCSFSQIGKQIHAGMTMSSIANCNLDAKGQSGFELGYSLFAKYSERLEWTSGFSYINSGVVLPAYVSDFSTQKYHSTDLKVSTSLMNVDYQLSYYIIPDMLAITGGGILGAAFSFPPDDGSVVISDKNLKEKDVYNTGDAKIVSTTDLHGKFIQAGLLIGASFTFKERYMAYVRYNYYLTKCFDTSENADMEQILGTPSMRIVRIGVAYKFLASNRNKRF